MRIRNRVAWLENAGVGEEGVWKEERKAGYEELKCWWEVMNRFDRIKCDQGEYGHTAECERCGIGEYAANNAMQIAKCVQVCGGIEDGEWGKNERVGGAEKLGEEEGGDCLQERLGWN